MVEQTDKPEKASGRSPAGKTARPTAKRTAKTRARKSGKTAAAASKPTKTDARKGRKRAAKAANENLAVAKEEVAARRLAGGREPEAAASNAPEIQRPNGIPAPAAKIDSGTASAEAKPEAAGRVPDSGRRGKTEPRTRAGEDSEGASRPNTLVPTNGIHVTERRLKRKLHQNRGVMALIAATLLGIMILGEQTAPPDLTEFEREIAASQTTGTTAGSRVASSPPGIIKPKLHDRSVAIAGPGASRVPEPSNHNLNTGELVEMERLLARLDLGPSPADGIVGNQTEAAIRLYQEIAGLPIDGAPSRALLADMREVVKILEDGG